MGPGLEVPVTKRVGRCGIEIQIDSVMNDGTQPWVVISWSVRSFLWTP